MATKALKRLATWVPIEATTPSSPVAEAVNDMIATGLEFRITIRSIDDDRDRVVIEHEGYTGPMGFGGTVDGAWEDFLNSWEDENGSRLVW